LDWPPRLSFPTAWVRPCGADLLHFVLRHLLQSFFNCHRTSRPRGVLWRLRGRAGSFQEPSSSSSAVVGRLLVWCVLLILMHFSHLDRPSCGPTGGLFLRRRGAATGRAAALGMQQQPSGRSIHLHRYDLLLFITSWRAGMRGHDSGRRAAGWWGFHLLSFPPFYRRGVMPPGGDFPLGSCLPFATRSLEWPHV
jgi:hypothetical protein